MPSSIPPSLKSSLVTRPLTSDEEKLWRDSPNALVVSPGGCLLFTDSWGELTENGIDVPVALTREASIALGQELYRKAFRPIPPPAEGFPSSLLIGDTGFPGSPIDEFTLRLAYSELYEAAYKLQQENLELRDTAYKLELKVQELKRQAAPVELPPLEWPQVLVPEGTPEIPCVLCGELTPDLKHWCRCQNCKCYFSSVCAPGVHHSGGLDPE